jgi:hypothetical protein
MIVLFCILPSWFEKCSMRKWYYSRRPEFQSYLWVSRGTPRICRTQYCITWFVGIGIELIIVVCRTIYLHFQICWNLHVGRLPLIFLNIIGWLIPAILIAVVFGAAQITYTISNHCSVRADWVVNLIVIPIIVEIGCAFVVQFATFIYCVNVYLRSLVEPPPPSNDSLGNRTATSAFSTGTGRYPYRKAMSRVNKVTPFHSLLIR